MNRRSSLHLLLGVILVCGYFGEAMVRQSSPIDAHRNFLWGDASGVYFTVRSLIEDGDLDLKNQLDSDPLEAADQMSLGRSGEWYPVHELLLPVAVLPLYLVLGTGGLWIGNIVLLTLIVVLLYDLAKTGRRDAAAFCAALLLGLNPIFLRNSFDVSSDVAGAFLLVGALYLFLRDRYFFAGLAAGAILIGRVPLVTAIPGFVALLAATAGRDRQRFGRLATGSVLGFSIGVAAFMALNALLWGSPFEVSYDHQAQGSVTGMHVASQRDSFSRPLLAGLWEVMFAADCGVAATAPAAFLLAAFGFRAFWKDTRPLALFLLTVFCVQAVQYAIYKDHSLIPPHFRHMLPGVALLIFPMTAALHSAFSRASRAS